MGAKLLSGLAAASFLILAMTRCSFGLVCPAIGWINTVDIHVDGKAGDVAVVEFCVDGVCGSSESSPPLSDGSVRLYTPGTFPPVEPSVAPTVSAPIPTLGISRVDESNWQALLGMTEPVTVTVRALSSTGQVLAETVSDLQWMLSGGSERCGGPSTTGLITLDVSS